MKHQTKPSFTLIGRSILVEGTTVYEQHYSKEKTAFYAQLFKEGMLEQIDDPFSSIKRLCLDCSS